MFHVEKMHMSNTKRPRITPAALLGTVVGLVMAAYLEREILADLYFYLTTGSVSFDASGEIIQ